MQVLANALVCAGVGPAVVSAVGNGVLGDVCKLKRVNPLFRSVSTLR